MKHIMGLRLWVAAALLARGDSSKRPSIMFILADDLGAGDVGIANEARRGDTPNFDRLAKESLTLTNFRVMSPVCSPSRASFMTGMESSVAGFPNVADCGAHQMWYVDRSGARRRTATDTVAWLNESYVSVAHALRHVGYFTAHLGKWHVGCEQEMPGPSSYGWDLARAWNAHPLPWPSYEPAELVRWLWEDKHKMNEVMVADATRVVDKKRPFYLSVNPVVPHSPLSPRREHMEAVGPAHCDLDLFWANGFRWTREIVRTYNEPPGGVKSKFFSRENWRHRQTPECVERVYRASVYSFDVLVGDLLALLDTRGIADDTLLVVTSDNGPETTETPAKLYDPTGRWSQVGLATPYRGYKRSLYEGGVRVPCLVRWPRVHGRAARVVADDVVSIDLLPTFARVAGADAYLDARPDPRRKGRVADVLITARPKKPSKHHQVVFWEWAFDMLGACDVTAPRFAVTRRDTGLKLLLDFEPLHPLTRTSSQLMPNSFRRHELYNLTADPSELTDLFRTAARKLLWTEIAAPLAQDLARWATTLLPPTNGVNHKYHPPCPRQRFRSGH